MNTFNRPIFSASLGAGYGQADALRHLVTTAETADFDLFSMMDHPYGNQAYEAYAALGYLLGAVDAMFAGFSPKVSSQLSAVQVSASPDDA